MKHKRIWTVLVFFVIPVWFRNLQQLLDEYIENENLFQHKLISKWIFEYNFFDSLNFQDLEINVTLTYLDLTTKTLSISTSEPSGLIDIPFSSGVKRVDYEVIRGHGEFETFLFYPVQIVDGALVSSIR